MFSFDKIYCHSMEYFHRVKIFSFDKKYIFIPECHVVLVRPGRIGPIRGLFFHVTLTPNRYILRVIVITTTTPKALFA